jgi:hypothetical protein
MIHKHWGSHCKSDNSTAEVSKNGSQECFQKFKDLHATFITKINNNLIIVKLEICLYAFLVKGFSAISNPYHHIM